MMAHSKRNHTVACMPPLFTEVSMRMIAFRLLVVCTARPFAIHERLEFISNQKPLLAADASRTIEYHHAYSK